MVLNEYLIYLGNFFDVNEYQPKEELYHNMRFRKWRFNAYINRQKSESRFMKRFRQKFGEPGETTVFLGDWSATHTLQGQVSPLLSNIIT